MKNVTITNYLCLHFLLLSCCLSSALLNSVRYYITLHAYIISALTQLTPELSNSSLEVSSSCLVSFFATCISYSFLNINDCGILSVLLFNVYGIYIYILRRDENLFNTNHGTKKTPNTSL